MEVVGCPNHFTFLWDIWDLWNKKFIVPVVPVNTKGRKIVFSQHLYYFDAIEPIIYTDSIDMSKAWYRFHYAKRRPIHVWLSHYLYLCLPTGFIGRLSEPFGFTIFLSLAQFITRSYIFFKTPFSEFGSEGFFDSEPEEFNKPRF